MIFRHANGPQLDSVTLEERYDSVAVNAELACYLGGSRTSSIAVDQLADYGRAQPDHPQPLDWSGKWTWLR